MIQGQIWKIATGGAALVSLVLGFLLLSAQIENRHLSKVNTNLDGLINDPSTGYARQLAQTRTNVATLDSALKIQSERLAVQSKEGQRQLAENERRLKIAQAESRRVRGQMDAFLKEKPKGETLEDRINDIDRRFLEMLP